MTEGGASVEGELGSWEEPAPTSLVLRDEAPAQRVYDLEERTARFAEQVVLFLKQVPRGPLTDRLIDQLVGASSSVAANYCEADDAVSKKEFRLRIGTCRKEARETKLFLRLIATAVEATRPGARELWREARELHLIFCSIYRNTRPD